MPRFLKIFTISVLSIVVLQGCNTLYNTSTVNIEVAVPAKIKLPKKYNNVVVKYNNSNASYNPNFSNYFEDDSVMEDSSNIDSIASEVYFKVFVETLQNQFLFDNVIVLEPTYYSGVSFSKTNNIADSIFAGSTNDTINLARIASGNLYRLIKRFGPGKTNNTKTIDPDFGLYSGKEIEQIAESTGGDLFLSFDYFASIDGLKFISYAHSGVETVNNITFWTIYDLQQKKLLFYYDKFDTIMWSTHNLNKPDVFSLKAAKRFLPERNEAILNAADISGTNFAQLMVPHWLEVQRMYYQSGHVDLKKAENLILKNEWIEAAKIWKNHVNNKNKSVAAKSMYNIALACEIEGDIDAAIDWVVKSFHVYGSKNETHYFNCMDYLKILGQRKVDIKLIENQLNPEISE